MTSADSQDLLKVARVLARHISPIHVRSVLRRALSESEVDPPRFKLSDIARIEVSLREGVRLFANEAVWERAQTDIAQLQGATPAKAQPEGCTIDVSKEADISVARGAVRQMCEQAGVKSFAMQKSATIVSELTRNIVAYTAGGKLELQWKEGPTGRRHLWIQATDEGPGILDLPAVLSGEYKSKTGLGRGLIGCKRLAKQFDITTGRTGTLVTVEVEL